MEITLALVPQNFGCIFVAYSNRETICKNNKVVESFLHSPLAPCQCLGNSEKGSEGFGKFSSETVNRPSLVQTLNGITLTSDAYATLLKGCSNEKALAIGKQIHSCIVKSRQDGDRFLGNHVMEMYRRCDNLQNASEVFDKIFVRNVFSWSIIISAYAHDGNGRKALLMYKQMLVERVCPNRFIFSIILTACSSLGCLPQGKHIHATIIKGVLGIDVVVKNALINMYCKCGSTDNAAGVFDKMPHKNVVSWTAMIAAYAQYSHANRALELFYSMQLQGMDDNKITFITLLDVCSAFMSLGGGKFLHSYILTKSFQSDPIVGSAIVNMYGKCSCVKYACMAFDNIWPTDLVSLNTMLAIYAQHGYGKEVLRLAQALSVQGLTPNHVTIVGMLDVLAMMGDLEEGKQAHAYVTNLGINIDDILGTALINMYNKCGSLDSARSVFDNMRNPDIIAWTAIIAAFAQHGRSSKAFELFQCMRRAGLKPNKVTLIGILFAASHAGMVTEGIFHFISMVSMYIITPIEQHFACIVDLLGRAGHLDEADDFMKNVSFEPSSKLWLGLLSTLYREPEQSEWAVSDSLTLGLADIDSSAYSQAYIQNLFQV